MIIGSHPSVVILSLANEDWSVRDIATNPETRASIARASAYLRRQYPPFLVMGNDGWRVVAAEISAAGVAGRHARAGRRGAAGGRGGRPGAADIVCNNAGFVDW